MKILIISDFSTPEGGTEIYLFQLRELLREAGHNVILFSSSVGEEGRRRADVECWGTNKKFITRLFRIFNPFSLLKLRKIVKKFEPDLVHLNMFLGHLSPSILLALKKVPVVYTVHTYELICPPGIKLLPGNEHCGHNVGKACLQNKCLPLPSWLIYMVRLSLVRRFLKFIDVILANSNSTKRHLQTAGIRDVRVQSYFMSTPHQNLPFPSTPTVCFIGQLWRVKGIDVLLHAMRHVADHIPEAHLLIAGDGPEKQRLKKLSEQLKLAKAVTFMGYVAHERLDEVWLRSQVQIIPSIWPEPFGLVAVEGMAAGRPIVATRAGGLEETVLDGKNGFLVSPGDVAELSQKILTLLNDPELAQRMGRHGAEVIRKKMNNQRILTQLLEVYDSLIRQYDHRGLSGERLAMK